MTYNDKALKIVKNAISSAIFIDDKAKDFYSNGPVDGQIVEENLSIDLHKGFKLEGISLSVHKFATSDIEDQNLKNYFFKDRDLILLDWELDGVAGEEYSLKLLSDIINYAHINFCCIYTRTNRFDNIFSQIETYFSGYNEEDFTKIKDAFSHLDEDDIEYISQYLNSDERNLKALTEKTGLVITNHPFYNASYSELDLIKSIKHAFAKNVKSQKREVRSNLIYTGSERFMINNTFVFLLQKDSENDPKPSILLKRISEEVIRNNNSFIQLLGLEMQTIFNMNERFIDDTLLRSSTSALFSHRNYLKQQQQNDVTFSSLIKKILIEHANLKLRTAKLSLLETDFLDSETPNYATTPTSEEVLFLNTFYNSVTVKSINNVDIPSLNFGDIFKGEDSKYYVCITALCDCYYPNKIQHNYFFAIGKEIDLTLGLKLGDTAFISFLPTGKCIIWGNVEIPSKESIKRGNLTEEEHKYKILESEKKALEAFLYKPFYIKPSLFNVKGSKIIENKISLRELTYRQNKESYTEDLVFVDLEYVTTLRPDYTQRIANHSFGHPARVGVDFVKL